MAGENNGSGEGGLKVEERSFEVPEKAADPKAVKPKTEKELEEAGYSPGEIMMARAAGQVAEKEKPAKDEKSTDDKGKPGDKSGEGDGTLQGAAVKDKDGDQEEPWRLSQEEETKLKETFGPNHKLTGLYFRTRSETRKRQKVAAQLAETNVLLEQERSARAALAAKLEKLEKAPPAGGRGGEKDPLEELLKEGGAGEKTGKEKPLTEADLERREAEKADKEKAAEQERAHAQQRMKTRLDTFIADAQERFDDYEEVTAEAEKVIKAAQQGEKELVALFGGDEEAAELAMSRAGAFVRSTVGALDWKEGQPTPAELFYRIGKMLKGKPSGEKPEEKVPAKDGEVERALKNAGKRPSAGVNGGGSPKVTAEKDLTVEQYLALPKHEKNRVSDATRKRLLQG